MTMKIAIASIVALAGIIIAAPDADAGRDRTPPCKFEDGPGRCVWDARHMGNGEGRSLVWREDGTKRFITHRRAHRLMTTNR